jgi:hypothetical protein
MYCYICFHWAHLVKKSNVVHHPFLCIACNQSSRVTLLSKEKNQVELPVSSTACNVKLLLLDNMDNGMKSLKSSTTAAIVGKMTKPDI